MYVYSKQSTRTYSFKLNNFFVSETVKYLEIRWHSNLLLDNQAHCYAAVVFSRDAFYRGYWNMSDDSCRYIYPFSTDNLVGFIVNNDTDTNTGI